MKLYLYRTINQCINGTADLCEISSHKLKLTKSGELAVNQAPFNKQGIIYTDNLKLFKIKKPKPNIITEVVISKETFQYIMDNKFNL